MSRPVALGERPASVHDRARGQRSPGSSPRQTRPVGSHGSRSVDRRRRVWGLVRLIIFLLLVFMAAWAGARVAQAGTDQPASEAVTYRAGVGDTLWQIAVDRYADHDPRRAVYEIRLVNGWPAERVLRPGDEIVLPDGEKWGSWWGEL